MAIGMTYEQYWYGDPLMVRAFYKAEQLRQERMNEEAWLFGAYTYRALDSTVGNMMRKKGAKLSEYPENPIGLVNQEETADENLEEQEEVYALAYMTNMVMAGKNWHK